ncbi:hypothetical protein JL721_1841 [Aureococcus anophagefferens]|nr:hypothetical protein JL721_1841 [Aureococcus anophagefferens]
MKKPAACPLGKYEWSRVVAFCGRLRAATRGGSSGPRVREPRPERGPRPQPGLGPRGGGLGRDAPPEAARAIVLESVAYRATHAAGLYLNSLLGSGLDVRPFDVARRRLRVRAHRGGRRDDRAAPPPPPAASGDLAPLLRDGVKAGLHTEVAGAVRAGRDDAGLPGGAVFCALRERSATGDFWNPAQSNPYGTEVCPCEYRGFVVGAALARLGDAGDVGRWGGAVLALERGGGGDDDAAVFGHLRLQQPFDRETGPPRRNSTAVPLRGALTPGAGGSWRLWATTDRGGVGTALRPSPRPGAAPSSPAAEACRRLWGDAAFGFDLSVAPRDGATFELTATLDADFSTITAVFRHNEGHPSFATTDGALAPSRRDPGWPGGVAAVLTLMASAYRGNYDGLYEYSNYTPLNFLLATALLQSLFVVAVVVAKRLAAEQAALVDRVELFGTQGVFVGIVLGFVAGAASSTQLHDEFGGSSVCEPHGVSHGQKDKAADFCGHVDAAVAFAFFAAAAAGGSLYVDGRTFEPFHGGTAMEASAPATSSTTPRST